MKKVDFKNRKVFLVLLVSIITISLATSTAYILANVLPEILNQEDMALYTDKLTLVYTDCATGNEEQCSNINKDLNIGESVIKTFQIKNEAKRKLTYTLYFKNLQNTFKNDDLVYKIENIDTGDVLLDTTPVPYRDLKSANIEIKSEIDIPGNTTQNYRMTVTFLNKDVSQNYNLDAKYFMKLSVLLEGYFLEESYSNEIRSVGWFDDQDMWQHRNDIKKVIFENTLNAKENVVYSYDISSAQDESVMAYLTYNEEDNSKYTAYIQTDGNLLANSDSSNLFLDFHR